MRTARTIVAVILFGTFTLLFLGSDSLPGSIRDTLLSLQFLPSLVELISHPGFPAGAGCLLIIITTMIFGRIYCAVLCPLGVLQDIFIRLSRICGIKRAHGFQKPYPLIRYGIAVATLATFLMGSVDMIGLLDPFSLFGRGLVHLFKPAALAVHNTTVSFLEHFDIYTLSVKKLHSVSRPVTFITVFSLAAVVFFSLFAGRLFCNTICPAGALMGLFSRRSLFRFRLDGTTCVSCGACEKVCKAGCIDIKHLAVDPGRCVSCFNCLGVCGKKAVAWNRVTRAGIAGVPARREWLTGALAVGTSLLFSMVPMARLSGACSRDTPKVLPPGAVSAGRFRRTCLGCHLCVSVCPTNVIIPRRSPFVAPGFLLPEMDYTTGFCDAACHACGQACPSGAIRAMSLPEKREVRVGSAMLKKELCIVHVKKKPCGACGEACPTFAISPVEKGQVLFPELNTDCCTGCGACEYACPVKPKAIIVNALPVHERAKSCRPVKKPELPPPLPKDDFPF